MKKVSEEFKTLLQQKALRYFILVDLDMNNRYAFTSLPYRVEFQGFIYEPDPLIVKYEPPRTSTVIDKETYKINLSDHYDFIQKDYRLGAVGSPFVVRLGLFDQNGVPNLNSPDDLLIAYKGNVDSLEIETDFSDDSKHAVLSGSSPLSALDLVAGFPTSRDGMDQINENDTAFDRIYDGSESTNLKWGKA